MAIDARLHRADGALTTLSDGRHAWCADVDRAAGSADAAPDPHALLDSALAACTALTLELYLRRRPLPVRAIHVHVEHEQGRDAEGRPLYRLRRTLAFDGELADAERAALLAIAERCPIHRLLSGRVEIETGLAAG